MNGYHYTTAWPYGTLNAAPPEPPPPNTPNSRPTYPMVVIDSPTAPQYNPQYLTQPAHSHYPTGLPPQPAYNIQQPNPGLQHRAFPQPLLPKQQSSPFGFDGGSDTPVKSVVTPSLPVDYRLLLLSLADQYISQARSLGTLIAYNHAGADRGRYQKLLATSLSCYEAVLKMQASKLPPRQEATVRLRYATLLYEETENYGIAEEYVTKCVSFCEQNRLEDLKYSSQYLLVRLMFRTSQRAALKLLDNAIGDAITCHHIPWVYAFRFLRVSLSMQTPTAHEIHAAITHLHEVGELSKRYSDSAVCMAAAALEGLVHLRSRKNDSLTEVQRALAAARAQQLNVSDKNVPQLHALVHLLDLSCSLEPYNPNTAREKLRIMHHFYDVTLKEAVWPQDGTCAIPLSPRHDLSLTKDTEGIFSHSSDGSTKLHVSWIGRTDIWLLGFTLSAASAFSTNAHEAHKTEGFLKEALKMMDEHYLFKEAPKHVPISTHQTSMDWRRKIHCYIHLQLGFAYCKRSEWKMGQTSLDAFHKQAPVTSNISSGPHLAAQYLSAIIQHGTGNLSHALSHYNTLATTLSTKPRQANHPFTVTDFYALLSIINTLLIIRAPSHPLHSQTTDLLARLTPFFPSSSPQTPPAKPSPSFTPSSLLQNPHLISAHNLLLAILPQSLNPLSPSISSAGTRANPILPTKAHLQTSLNLAHAVSNNLLSSLCLSHLHTSFFRGIVGDQAVNSARAARKTAKESGARLWEGVGCGILADALERQGVDRGERDEVLVDGQKVASALPGAVREGLGLADEWDAQAGSQE